MTYELPKLTKREQARLLRAAKRIDAGKDKLSCVAILKVSGYKGNLAEKYGKFISPGLDGGVFSHDFDPTFTDSPEARAHRVMALLMFREVCGE